jgi:tetratricopeptide (TPR) repeat protein
MSRVYLAHEVALGRKVVVKVLPPDLAAGVSVDRFKREIQLAAMLQHPHIVPVLSSGDFDGLPWFTMPYVEGESLRARLTRGPLAIADAVRILKDVARALEFAHAHGIVHRDIKPDNVLLAGNSATVTDFGIAKALTAAREDAPSGTLTATGTSVGTPTYIAPEQAAGDPTVDQRSDLYSFGVVAYELLAGRPPFQGATPAKVVAAHFSETPHDIRELRPDTPAALADLVMQCLEKDPAARPRTASDVVRILESVVSTAAPFASPPQTGIGKAIGLWAIATLVVAIIAWGVSRGVGLPEWVVPGAIVVMLTPLALKASSRLSWKRASIVGTIAIGAFAVGVAAFMAMRVIGIGPAASLIGAGKLDSQERLIITDFEGPPGDSTLGITVTEALRADLSESSALRLLPRFAINETLRLMKLPTATPIDFTVARQIATSEGVKAVLDGNIVSLGGRYVLSARLVSAQTGNELAAFRQEASSQKDLIPAIGRLAKQLRSKIGESLKTIRESSSLERVTTSSMDALSKYAEALSVFDRTNDYSRSIPLLQQAVAIDSTFAMAWRRLSSSLSSIGQTDGAAHAAAKAYAYRDRLGGVERDLTAATYFQNGPEADEEQALAAFESVLARDSLNSVALNNASIIMMKQRQFDRAATLLLRAATQDKGAPNPIVWANALASLGSAGRKVTAESLLHVWSERAPEHPAMLVNKAHEVGFLLRDYDGAERLYRELLPKIASSRTITDLASGDLAEILLLRGRVREALRVGNDVRLRQIEGGDQGGVLRAGADSASAAIFIDDSPSVARAQLRQALRRVPASAFALVNRPYGLLLSTSAFAGDAPLTEQLRAEYQTVIAARGKPVDRPAAEALADGLVAFARGHYDETIGHLSDADRKLHPCTYCIEGVRFVAFDRLGRADSAIASGEAYLALVQVGRAVAGVDGLFRPGILQRLGEMYEAKGMTEKALAHYQSFLELWKNADPDLQPRVRDVRGRVARLQAAQARAR